MGAMKPTGPEDAAANVVDLAVQRAKASIDHLERLLARAELAAEELETEAAAAPKFKRDVELIRTVLAQELLGQAMLRAQVEELGGQVEQIQRDISRLARLIAGPDTPSPTSA